MTHKIQEITGDLIHIGAGEERALKVNGQEPACVMVMTVGMG